VLEEHLPSGGTGDADDMFGAEPKAEVARLGLFRRVLPERPASEVSLRVVREIEILWHTSVE
jgi:hypothetical protein